MSTLTARQKERRRKKRLLADVNGLAAALELPSRTVRQMALVGGILRTRQVCERLGLSPWTIGRLVKAGKLIARGRFRGRYVFEESEISLFQRWGPPRMTTGQAARALRRHIHTVGRYARQGRLPFQFEGMRRIFARVDVVEFARLKRRPAGSGN